MNWPDHFPDNCPDKECFDANGIFFRLVENDLPTIMDFLPSSNLARTDLYGDPHCISCGISIFQDVADIIKLKQRYRRAFAQKKIASGQLHPYMGKMKHTPFHWKTHYTWWLPDGFDPCPIFKVMSEL